MPEFEIRVLATTTLDFIFKVEAEDAEDACDIASELAEDPAQWGDQNPMGDVEILDAFLADQED